jgi:phospholipase/carboxylesterase
MAGAKAAAGILNEFLDGLLRRFSLPDGRMALVGFSQGTMMALEIAPKRAAPFAGVVGFSGRLLDDGTWAKDIRTRPPVLLVHGDADPMVPVANLDHAATVLKGAGFVVETLRRPGLAHGIDQEGIAAASAFLRRVLA